MMAITVVCACGKRFGAKDEHAGKRFRCPGCGGVVSVPCKFPPPETASAPHAPAPKAPAAPVDPSLFSSPASTSAGGVRRSVFWAFMLPGCVFGALVLISGMTQVFRGRSEPETTAAADG